MKSSGKCPKCGGAEISVIKGEKMKSTSNAPAWFQDTDFHYCMQCGYKESYQRLDVVPIVEQVQKMQQQMVIVAVVTVVLVGSALFLWYMLRLA
ncbi:MAG TPA: hypothetical protein EYN58_00345 [Candidatus Poseidoniales archaeon]|nr:hypothetical protein [Candidatus Poseidoniales archaeon]HIB23778.1 hypothetical protein [Candidatus Poseidoniales archaeon]HIB41758.1 hypothetical protein [Candidatus Poseidoniales archaeon]HIO24456.1 hypothetical protein [Candidatus Poseidoniales archaeon]HIO57252.1 hypothetical protein [Candidatus Poseidoniales archaeon]